MCIRDRYWYSHPHVLTVVAYLIYTLLPKVDAQNKANADGIFFEMKSLTPIALVLIGKRKREALYELRVFGDSNYIPGEGRIDEPSWLDGLPKKALEFAACAGKSQYADCPNFSLLQDVMGKEFKNLTLFHTFDDEIMDVKDFKIWEIYNELGFAPIIFTLSLIHI